MQRKISKMKSEQAGGQHMADLRWRRPGCRSRAGRCGRRSPLPTLSSSSRRRGRRPGPWCTAARTPPNQSKFMWRDLLRTPHVPGYLEDVESYLPGEVQLEKQLGRGPILGSLGGADNPIYHRVLRQPELRVFDSWNIKCVPKLLPHSCFFGAPPNISRRSKYFLLCVAPLTWSWRGRVGAGPRRGWCPRSRRSSRCWGGRSAGPGGTGRSSLPPESCHGLKECCRRLIGELLQSRRRPLLGPFPWLWKAIVKPMDRLQH